MELLSTIDFRKILKLAVRNGGDFADIFCEHAFPTVITCEDGKIEHIASGVDGGAGVRVIANHKTTYAFTNVLNNQGLSQVAEAVSSATRGNHCTHDRALIQKGSWASPEIKRLPQNVSIDEKVALVKKADAAARAFDVRIRQVKVIYADTFRSIAVANTRDELVCDHRIGVICSVQVVASQGEVLQTGYEARGGRMGFELFQENPPEEIAQIASARAIGMLMARRAPGGRMPVVLSGAAGGTMIHEAIGHGLEADLVQMGFSVYAGRRGDMVASPLVSVVDDATLQHKRGSYAFDDEGVPGQRTLLVDRGLLKGYLYDYLTALKDNTVSTGNGRRESYKSRPLPRMSNTFILPGFTEPNDIVRSTGRGLLVKKMGGGQVNTLNGDFVFQVTEGYLIEGGEVGEAVRGATLTGNGPAVLKSIDMVGNDLGFGIGTCGKEGQGIPVADAQPTLRIPEMVVGGEV